MKPDPRLRRDGLCSVCRQPRPVPAKTYAGRLQHQRDPFCSMQCAVSYHQGKEKADGLRRTL